MLSLSLRFPFGRLFPLLLAPQPLFVVAGIEQRLAVTNLDDLAGELVDEVPIVRDEDQGAAEIFERFEQHILRVEVEMVGRLVEQQRVRRPQEHARHGQPRPLASGQHSHGLVDVVAREEEPAEDIADGRHHVDGRVAGERLVDGEGRIEARRLVLREILHHDLMPVGAGAAVGRLDA